MESVSEVSLSATWRSVRRCSSMLCRIAQRRRSSLRGEESWGDPKREMGRGGEAREEEAGYGGKQGIE